MACAQGRRGRGRGGQRGPRRLLGLLGLLSLNLPPLRVHHARVHLCDRLPPLRECRAACILDRRSVNGHGRAYLRRRRCGDRRRQRSRQGRRPGRKRTMRQRRRRVRTPVTCCYGPNGARGQLAPWTSAAHVTTLAAPRAAARAAAQKGMQRAAALLKVTVGFLRFGGRGGRDRSQSRRRTLMRGGRGGSRGGRHRAAGRQGGPRHLSPSLARLPLFGTLGRRGRAPARPARCAPRARVLLLRRRCALGERVCLSQCAQRTRPWRGSLLVELRSGHGRWRGLRELAGEVGHLRRSCKGHGR